MFTVTKFSSVADLRKEVQLLRSFVIGVAGRDPEGDYRPNFVRRILTAAAEAPRHRFVSAAAFLSHLRRE